MNEVDKEKLYADELLAHSLAAAEAFESFDQVKVDRVVEAVYRAAFAARIRLAEAAHGETRLGVVRDKVLKNAFASLIVYRDIKDAKTVGMIGTDPERGLVEVAQPLGPVLSLTPVTNPTSTVINKALICMKTRNPVIFSPHRAAKKCSRMAAQIVYEAALEAGAPEHCIQWSTKSKWSYTEALMQHRDVGLILATTAFHFVREAYRSGNPVLGAGEGNVPVFVHPSADLDFTARSLVESKTFDHGTVCCSEQALVVTAESDGEMREALEKQGGYFCSSEEVELLGKAAFDPEREIMRVDVVGKSATNIAGKIGIAVPGNTRLLLAPLHEVGPEEYLSHEILAPLLAYYVVPDMEAGKALCRRISGYHGSGHTLVIYTRDESVVQPFAEALKAGRVLINTPSSLGGLGGTLNRIPPSLTLSCGARGKNFTSDNISIHHLLNINRISRPTMDPVWEKVPEEAWMDPAFDGDNIDVLSP